MLIKNTTVVFKWILSYNSTLIGLVNEAYFDLQITAPSGAVTYLEGVNNWATSYVNMNASGKLDGEISYSLPLTEVGVYTLILGTGNSTNFTIIDTSLALVVDSQTEIINTAHP